MKRNYFIIAALLFGANLDAQITLSSANHLPVIGDAFTYVAAVSPTISVTHGGANQTWNFSTVTGTATPYNYGSLASSVEPATFPSANNVESSSGAENYYFNSTTSHEIAGQLIPGSVRAIYSDRRETLKFPITYNDVFNETFACTVENITVGQTYDRSGTSDMTADGYGSLILPYGTVNDVLKVTIVGNYADLFMGITVASYIDTIITFYNAGTNNVVASYTSLYYNGNPFVVQATYIDQGDLVIGINDVMANSNAVTLYPNPAKNHITIESRVNLNKIEILDLTGKFVREIKVSSSLAQTIDITDLNSGVYFVRYSNETETKTQKIIVE